MGIIDMEIDLNTVYIQALSVIRMTPEEAR